MSRILVITDRYLPGWKAGGPVRSLANLTEALGAEFDFRIITRDRDHTDTSPFPDVTVDMWVQVGSANVYYAPPRTLTLRGLAKVIRPLNPDMVFLFGFFSLLPIKYLVLRRVGALEHTPTLLAPLGQLDPSALAHKHLKKRSYIALARATGLVGGIDWQGSTAREVEDIDALFDGAISHVASDLPKPPAQRPAEPPMKQSGCARFVFISRISHMKNLPFLLRLLGNLEGEVELDVYGSRDPGPWIEEQTLVGSLPGNIQVNYKGVLRHADVDRVLARAHFFVLATLGENFGHAIFEALRAGCPVVISDRTPWRDLARQGAGWDLALEDWDAWVATLQRCIDMGNASYRRLSGGAHTYARRWYSKADPVTEQSAVFRSLLQADS